VFEPIARGGIVMIPLLLCSVIALIVSVERWLYLRNANADSEQLMGKVRSALQRSSPQEARGVCDATLAHFGMPKEDLREVAREVALAQQPVLEGHLSVLATMVTIAPLLGLLGTISGLIKVFHVMAGGGIGDASALSQGIAEALITTFTGLCIAIPFMVVYNWLSGRVESLTHEMERRVTELLNIQTTEAVAK